MAKDPKADEAPADEAADKAPAANPKKKLIMIIVAVLVLAIAGGAGWYFMQPKDDHKKVQKHGDGEEGDHGDEEGDGHGDAEEEDEPEEDHASAPVFVPLETFTVNLQPDPDERFLQLDISLQFKNEAHAEKIKAHMPAIRNRILMLLSSKQASEINTLEGKQQLTEALLAEVQKPFNEHGKKQKVQGVFFTSFVIQ